jgi:outer membrane protein OmpA-like peptidoglycan-associated protein
MKVFIAAILLIVSCSKKVITVEELPQEPKSEIMMTFPLEEPLRPPPVPMDKIKQCVVVYFKFDSDELQESEKWKISNIDQPVELTGGCCQIGTEEYNYTLGLKRGYSVKRFFDSLGVVILSVKSVGENNPITTNKNEYNLNRRCEIRY